jgi:hypothetical protein
MPTFTYRLNSGRLLGRAPFSVSCCGEPPAVASELRAHPGSSGLRPLSACCPLTKISCNPDPAPLVSSFSTGTATPACPDAGSAWVLPSRSGRSSDPAFLPHQSTKILEAGFLRSNSEAFLSFLSLVHQTVPGGGPSGPTLPPSSHPALAVEELLFATAIEVHQ